jgi:hypothetical protein
VPCRDWCAEAILHLPAGLNSAERLEKARDFEKSDLGSEAHHGHQHGNLAPTEGNLREKAAARSETRETETIIALCSDVDGDIP